MFYKKLFKKGFMKNKFCYMVLFLIIGGAVFVYYDPLELFTEAESGLGGVPESNTGYLRATYIGTDMAILTAGINIHVIQGDIDIFLVLNDMHSSDTSVDEFEYDLSMTVTVTWLFDDSDIEAEFSLAFPAGLYNIGGPADAVRLTIIPI